MDFVSGLNTINLSASWRVAEGKPRKQFDYDVGKQQCFRVGSPDNSIYCSAPKLYFLPLPLFQMVCWSLQVHLSYSALVGQKLISNLHEKTNRQTTYEDNV